MAASRARRILNLVSPTSTAQNEGLEDNVRQNYMAIPLVAEMENSVVLVKDSTIAVNEENVSPNISMIQEQHSARLDVSIDSSDEIYSDSTNNYSDLKYDYRLISSRKREEFTDNRQITEIQKVSTLKSSLVPDYDSDDSFVDLNRNPDQKSSTKSISSSSSSSSTSSSSSSSSSTSSSSSSDSDSPTLPKSPRQCSQDDTEANLIELDPKIVENDNSHNFNRADLTMNNSPRFTDESSPDLSDNDPTFNYENLTDNRRKKKNYLFEPLNSDSNTSDSDDNSSDSNNTRTNKVPKKRGRKRLRNPEKWRQNKTKKLRNTGEAYVSMSNSRKKIDSRCLKVPCTDKCKLKCTQNINNNERYDIFKEFWDLGDLIKQRAYISNCMVEIIPKYRYTNAEKPRQPNKAYNFTVNKKKIRVCKTFFKSTLDISDRMIFTVQTKVSDGGVMLEDLRGKHGNHKKLSPELVDDIRKHIQSIPRIESHYLRAASSRQYIDGSKSLKDLYNDFVQQQVQMNKESGNYMSYYKIFTKEFNLGFFQPKKDQCDLCVAYNNSSDDKKKELEDKYKTHLEEKILSRAEKQTDRTKITKDDKVAIYDLEAVLQCPRGDSSAFYYKSKLNSYNLTVTELTKSESKTAYDNVHCYFWTESEAKRGAVEIGTCILKYLERICNESTGEKNVTFFSDNCCGQNKNKYIASLYLFAVQTMNVKTITHKFLIKGHTQNEADSVHSLIEKEVKRNLKSGPIYSPDQYIALIKNAKKSKPALNVHELTFDSFMDIKLLQEEWGYNFNIDTEGQTVNWNNIKVLMMTKEKPFSFFCKHSYKDESFREVDVRNKRKKMKLINDITLKKAYAQRQDISVNKKKDLKELISKGLIPSYYANFYNGIIT